MPRFEIARFLPLAAVLALPSCAAPKAAPVVEKPAPKVAAVEAPVEVVAPPPDLPSTDNFGIRMPDLTGLPGDEDFLSTTNPKPPGEAGAVISRPPTDPPSRRKPAEPAGQ